MQIHLVKPIKIGSHTIHPESIATLIRFALDRSKDTRILEVASSMTLTTLLSLVPLIAVMLAGFTAFPSFASKRADLEQLIIESFLPPQYTEQLIGYIQEFSSHASGLGLFGVIGLALTALLLIDKFFVTMHRIFKAEKMRSAGQRAVLYWAILTLAPLGIAASLTLSGEAIKIAVDSTGEQNWLLPYVITATQILIQTAGYALLYKLVPNCLVKTSDALIGGFSAAVLSQFARAAFSFYVTSSTLGPIYGAFVAVPVFLLWLYATWILVLLGAAVTATIPLLTSGRYADSYRRGNDFVTGIAILAALTKRRQAGVPIASTLQICDWVDSYPQAAISILKKLEAAGYAARIETKDEEPSWALLADPDKTNLEDSLKVLLIDPRNKLVADEGPLADWFKGASASEAFRMNLAALAAKSTLEVSLD